ncbi:MAG: serine/threonine protein phosphatase [Pirellulaceae bacterium]|nr:serine/threonine protein phosphatase [Pirellulaceae bacterium]
MVPAQTKAHGRLLAIGDIHGCLTALEAVLDAIQLTAADHLVILGDFVNRGPATRQVIDRLIRLQTETQLVIVLGNHEEEMLAAREDFNAFRRWLSMGGAATLNSYPAKTLASAGACSPAESNNAVDFTHEQEDLSKIPAEHWQFLESAVAWWESGEFFFTHAGYDADLPLSEQTSIELRWLGLSERTVRPHCSGKTAIVGHTPNLLGRVVDFGFLRCLDTGCGLGGYLTAMDIHSRHIWQCAQGSQKVVWK